MINDYFEEIFSLVCLCYMLNIDISQIIEKGR